MPGRLTDKVAIVTGGGAGIGAATVAAFHAEGAKVVAADISGREADIAAQLGGNCFAVHADVSQASDVQRMVAAAIERFGRLDVLHNNAGIDAPACDTGEYSEEAFDRVWAVNGRGVFLGMRYAIPAMLESGGGSIINTASVASAVVFPGKIAYCAAKGAVTMLTRTTAVEYAARGIRVNAICPGMTKTGHHHLLPRQLIEDVLGATPMGRVAQPSEIADLTVYLASDESRFVTGASVVIDGGYTLQ
jgi:NAD(P)-dependent dehydrogenase (short-subunit alcohol dehydrogenase family)